ncbi:MAG TPA: MBL fold metallo-hydrolase [Dehalococcoidia bacterium]|nr:MBL fold metallo-hydrolase [Dehalococcoidia bacterium]
MLERKTGIPLAPEELDIQKITSDIYTIQCSVVGQDAHTQYTSWVITEDGVVIIDPGSYRVCTMLREELDRAGQSVKYLIYTHAHGDHIGGAAAFLDQELKVIAHENTLERLRRYELTAGYIRRINSVQFHFNIPVGTPQRRFPPVYPTETYHHEYRFELGGKTFELFHAKGETDDCTVVWVPQLRAVFLGDLLEASFPNLGNPFKVMRYAREWAMALEKAVALDPEFAIGGDCVLTDNKEINEVLSVNIELFNYLEDSVIRATNDGHNLEQMIEEIQLPPHLADNPYLKQVYSRLEFAIYNIWRRYCGYFDFSPSGLLPRPGREVAGVVRQLIGNDPAILHKAEELMNQGQLQLALETLDIILKVDYENMAARRLRHEILRKMVETDECLMSHNVWVHYLEEDESFLGQ